jgi:hypothetical protein
VRGHWGVENCLHWRLDVLFKEDASRIRKGHAPAIMTTMRHLAMNLFEQEASKLRLSQKRRKAALERRLPRQCRVSVGDLYALALLKAPALPLDEVILARGSAK